MPRTLVLTKHPREDQTLIEAARLPDSALVAASDVEDGLARGGNSQVLVPGHPARVTAALPRLPNLRWVQLTWAGVERMLDPACLRCDDVLHQHPRRVRSVDVRVRLQLSARARAQNPCPRVEAQREGRWYVTLPGTLQGKTIGLVGVRPDRRTPAT